MNAQQPELLPSSAPERILTLEHEFVQRKIKVASLPKGGDVDAHLNAAFLASGRIVPGHAHYRTPEQVEAWFAEPRGELNGRAWIEFYRPSSHEEACRFIAVDEEEVKA